METKRTSMWLAFAMAFCSACIVHAQNYFVAPNGNDSASGTSWEQAFLTIQKGIDTATAGQSIAVSNGTYVLTTALSLNKGVTVMGVGGSANTVIDANLTGRILTISDGEAVMDGFTLKNGKSATAINGTGVNMTGGTLRNCTVSACTNTASSGTIQGVGVYMTAGTLDTCTIEKNRASINATLNGGGLYVAGASCLVTNCLISDNYLGLDFGTSKGGGVYLSAGKLLASVVKNNTVNQGRYIGGGAGVFVTGAGTVSNCTVAANALTCVDTTTRGGGLYVEWGTVANCTITNNSCDVNRSAGGGGGVFVPGAGTVLNCMIAGNSVPCVDPTVATGGGGVYVDGGRVVECVVSNNSSSYYRNSPGTFGGGVRMTGTSLVERCVITRNYLINKWQGARYGAGVACDGGIMRSCLIMGNTANSQGGGLYITGGTNENCTIVRNQCLFDNAVYGIGQYGGVYWTNNAVIINAIVYNNTSSSGENNIAPIVGGVSGVTYSCSPSLTSGTGNITGDPCFADSGSGSGTTFTLGDYRPVIGSPCEKTGFVSSWMSTALDLAGLSRLNGTQADMGCYLVTISPRSTFVSESGSDSNDGTSWATAFRTVQKGIDAATALGTVSVSNGTYVLASQLLLGKACTVIGIGGRSSTIIDANASGRIMTIDSVGAVVDGFTLKNGKSATAINGTGINMTGGTLRNCTISSCTNTATTGTIQGVGIYMTGGTLDTCTIERNRAASTSGPINGGGICIEGSTCSATNCLIAENYIGQEWATASKGGGAYLSAGKLLVSVVKNNTVNQGRYSNGGGGGVFVTGAGSVSNCTFSANAVTCVDTITRGGGVYVNWGMVVDCVISNNSGQGYSAGNGTFGGGIYMTGTSLVERCVITKNYQNVGWTSSRYGAGVASDGGTMRSCLIMGNTANTAGGGLYITGGTNENCTIVRNACSGGNYGGVAWTNSPVIINAIVYNNTGGIENNILPVVNGLSQVTYSCAPSLTSGTGNITADPIFTASGSGSGTTFTPGDYRLAAGTPCRNRGLTELWMKTATDLDGLPRIKDFLVDMGAYERQTASGSMIKFF